MASKFHGVDFYDVDGLLSEEERAVRDTVRQWVDENLMPVIGEAYVVGKFPKQLVPGMAALGLFGANLPEAYGCAARSYAFASRTSCWCVCGQVVRNSCASRPSQLFGSESSWPSRFSALI